MTAFRYLHGAVYLLENTEAHRVKIGMTINRVIDRLINVNDKWLAKSATCQICGGRRLINAAGLVPRHVVSGVSCPGGNNLPLEKDLSLAESYLQREENRIAQISGIEKNSVVRIVNNLKKRIDTYRCIGLPVGEWKIGVVFYTECAEEVELLTHRILEQHLDKQAPFGEVFCCSVSVATAAVETVLSQLGLLHSVRRETPRPSA